MESLGQWCEGSGRCEEPEDAAAAATDPPPNPLAENASAIAHWLAWKLLEKLVVSFIIASMWHFLRLVWRCLASFFDDGRREETRAIDLTMQIVEYEEEEQDDADCD